MGDWRYILSGFVGFIAIALTIAGSITFGIERHKENNLVENKCLVVDAVAIQHSCGNSICYAPVWTVQYNDTTTTMNSSRNRVRITGSYSRKYAAALDELEEYPVGSTHTCYHDKRSGEKNAQWEKPNSKSELICLLVGIGLIVVSVASSVLLCIADKYTESKKLDI